MLHANQPSVRPRCVPRTAPALLALLLAGCASPIKAPVPVAMPSVAEALPSPSRAVYDTSTPSPQKVAPGSVAEASKLATPPQAQTQAPLGDPVVLIAPLDGGDAGMVASAAQAASATGSASASAKAQRLAQGMASWYGPRFHGRRTANGERYDMHALTAAHKSLPFGTRLRVRSVHTGKEVVVRINDRGPYKHQRIIDLSRAAMVALGTLERGVTEVELLRD